MDSINLFRLEELKEINSTKEKQEKLTSMIEDNPYFEDLIRIVFNEDVYNIGSKTFYNIFEIEDTSDYEDAGQMVYFNNKNIPLEDNNFYNFISIEDIKMLIKTVSSLSGDNLKSYLKEKLPQFSNTQAKWLTRILLKDLRLGMQLKSVNKVLNKAGREPIEKFKVQLAGSKELDEWDKFPVFMSVKYDGFRCVVEKQGDNIKMTSRQGKDVSSFLPELVEMFKKIDEDFILDGEVMAKTFNDIQQRIGCKNDLTFVEDLHYIVFDILKIGYEDLVKTSQSHRYDVLDDFIPQHKNPLLGEETRLVCFNKENLSKFFEDVVRSNGEGVMIKDMEATYDYGSRKNWFKLKPIYDATMMVVGYGYGKGKYARMIGQLYCEDKTGRVKAKVGSGLTDEIRDDDELLSKLDNNEPVFIDVKYSEISKNKKGQYSLRHPRFDKFREDKFEADDIDVE